MGRLTEEVKKLTSGFVRKGGKRNRQQQAARMMAFAQHCEALGAVSMGRVGSNHVLSYYRATASLSASTRYNHYRALVALWQLAGKAGLPPEPTAPGSTMATQKALTTAKPSFRAVDVAQAESREAP